MIWKGSLLLICIAGVLWSFSVFGKVLVPQFRDVHEASVIPKHWAVQCLIVIDPGHGGKDPGALAPNGFHEADIVLEIAQTLRAHWQKKTHINLLLTRSENIYLPLRERFRLAQKKGAHLFISLHADSEPHGTARGSAIYTLSEHASDEEAAYLAKEENKKDIIHGVNLEEYEKSVLDLLIDLNQRHAMNQGLHFAHTLKKHCSNKQAFLCRQPFLRFADFTVLKAPTVPSVLLELGFLSTPEEITRLQNPKEQQNILTALTQAIITYCQERPP